MPEFDEPADPLPLLAPAEPEELDEPLDEPTPDPAEPLLEPPEGKVAGAVVGAGLVVGADAAGTLTAGALSELAQSGPAAMVTHATVTQSPNTGLI